MTISRCKWCGHALTGRQRKYCSPQCSNSWRNSLLNPWHQWVIANGGKLWKAR